MIFLLIYLVALELCFSQRSTSRVLACWSTTAPVATMFVLSAAVAATALFATKAFAQQQYTVWASVIFSRTGERTPEVLGFIPTTVTSLGAQQAYSAGSFFRDRYVSSVDPMGSNEQTPLQGLNPNTIDPRQLYVMTLDEQFTVASAQAFTQGLYPPFMLNDTVVDMLDGTSMLSNGSYVSVYDPEAVGL